MRHSGRVFAGYTNKVVTSATRLAYLQGIPKTENYRLNWAGSVNSTVGSGFSIATTVAVRYDPSPLPGIEKTDVTSSISLVYQRL
ncbi:MAG: DUF481 domain-containing protein [Polyangiaceae bacterium]